MHDDHGVVHIGPPFDEDGGIHVQIVVQGLFPHGEIRHQLAPVQVLFLAVDDPGLCQLHHAGVDHLCMDAQIVLAHQLLTDGVRDTADPQLDAVSVLNEACHITPDLLLGRVGHALGQDGQRRIDLHQIIHVPDMDLGVSEHPGQPRIDLQDHNVRRLQSLHLMDQAHGHGEKPVVVHGRDHAHKDPGLVVLQPAAGVVVQVSGIVAQAAQGRSFPGRAHHKVAVDVHQPVILRVHHKGMLPHGQAVQHGQTADPAMKLVQVVQEGIGLPGALRIGKDITVPEQVQNVVDGDELAAVFRGVG